jgi:hypothetical protein
VTLRTQYDEAADIYELVDDIEGVPVAFAFVEGGHVRGRIENAKASQLATPAKQTTEPQAEAQPAEGEQAEQVPA